ncbi:MAG: trypsin-like serine protease [Proteobacteria bacterium]|nr:trypsin-like serine protease [Pseudomonadota bacterium]
MLTAAHCFEPGDGGDAFQYRTEGGIVREGVEVWRHPRYNGNNEKRGGYDAALVRLDGPVSDGGPPPLLWAGDIAVGQRIVFVGYGNRGLASTGEQPVFDEPDANKTAGENTIDEVTDATRQDRDDDDSGNWMSVTLRRPSEGAGRLDGLLGSGDSGGSAWMRRDGAWYVVGVNVSGTGVTYGEQSFFLRLAGIRPWLSGLLPGLRFSP